jgi:hypothetical protein
MNIFGNPTNGNSGFQSPAETTLDMNNYKIINLDNPINNKDGANKLYVDSAISYGLPPGVSYGNYIFWDNITNSYQSGRDKVNIGEGAGFGAEGGTVSLGGAAGLDQKSNCIAIGSTAGINQSYNSVAIGLEAGQNQNESSVAVGQNAGKDSSAVGGTAIGCNAGINNSANFSTCIGFNSVATIPYEVALGDPVNTTQVKSHGYFVSDQGFKLSSGGSNTQYFTTDGGVGTPSSSGSSNIYLYSSSTNTDLLTINAGQIRYNNSVQPIANQICISHLTRNSIDIDPFLELVAINNIIYIQDQNTSLNYIKYKVIAPPSVSPNNFYVFTVSHLDSAGTGATNFSNGHDIFMSIYTDTATIDSRLNTLDTQVLDLQNNKLSLSGGFMSGSIDMQNNGIDHTSYLSFYATTNCGFANIDNYPMEQNILLGSGNTNNDSDQILVGVGNSSSSGSNVTLAVGYVNVAESNYGLCIGQNNTHGDTQQNQYIIGSNNTTSGEGAMAFGSNITNGTKNSLCIGTSNMQWIFPNSGSCALGHPGIHPFKELYIDGGIIRTTGTANELYCGDGTIDTVTINNAASALTIANEKVSKSGDTMTGNLILQHDIYQNSRMITGTIYATNNTTTLSAIGTLITTNITTVGNPTNTAVAQSNTSVLNKIVKLICTPSSVAAFQDSGYLGSATFYRASAGLYVGMGWSYNICFGIADTNISSGICGMQVGFVASTTSPIWSALITPDNTVNWFGVGHNYSDSQISFYNKGSLGTGSKISTPYGVSTPSTLYFSLTAINQFGSNDVLLVLKELITNTSVTQNYTMSGTNSVSNTTRLYPVFTRMYGATAPSGGAQISFSSMTLTA